MGLSWQLECDCYVGLEIGGFAVLNVRFEAPLANRIEGRAAEYEVATNQLDVSHCAIGPNKNLENDRPFEALRNRDGWIVGIHLL